MHTIHEQTVGEYTVRVTYDPNPEHANPRECAYPSTMVCWHSRYRLGDEQPNCQPHEYMAGLLDDTNCPHCQGEGRLYEDDGYTWYECPHCEGTGEMSPDEIQDLFEQHYYVLPLYLYDHSGITMKTSPFSCPWDSGRVGFIYISKEKAAKEFGANVTPEFMYAHLDVEVKEYDAYLRGEVYAWEIEKDGEIVDSCGGYLGDGADEYALQDALSVVRK